MSLVISGQSRRYLPILNFALTSLVISGQSRRYIPILNFALLVLIMFGGRVRMVSWKDSISGLSDRA